MSTSFQSQGHSGDESHHYYRQASSPTVSDPLNVGDIWSDTAANLLKRCTSLSPVTFVSVEGGSAAHNLFSATHGDVDEADVPADNEVLTYDNAAGKWKAEAADGHAHANAHASAHTVSSHSDTTITGAETETLSDGSDADALHTHAGKSDTSHSTPGGSLTVQGHLEVATVAETDTGTDAGRAVSPDGLAGSYAGMKYLGVTIVDYTTNMAIGDGKFYFHIPDILNGMDLKYVHAEVITAGTTGTCDVQIANVTQAVDMLTTKLTIDSAETGSDTAATAAVIDTANDDVATNDVLRVDVDAVHTTPAKGLIVTLGFGKP